MRQSKRIALAGISSALSTMFLIMSVYVPLADMSFMVLASLALILPIAKNDIFGACLAFVSTSLLGMLCSGNVVKVLPYIIFFGFHPILISLIAKWKMPFFIGLAIKLVFANVAIFLAYRFFGLVINLGGIEFPYYMIAVAGSALFFLYDWLIERIKLILSYYIDKFINKNKNLKNKQ